MKEQTDQERFWAGEFGDEYTRRNEGGKLVAANAALFARILARAGGVGSVLELGANRGLNLRAMRSLLPEGELAAVEINAAAVDELRQIPGLAVHHQSILEFDPGRRWDLVFTKGVLIHLPPETMPVVFDLLERASGRYVAIIEYYNPVPVEVPYRGHRERLFKRDFAGEFIERHPSFRLVDYGFVYRRDPVFPLDDVTWFLMERSGA
jgi:pseudaminic acid biosynthesis-associated methylase